jgi:hypothetical protein
MQTVELVINGKNVPAMLRFNPESKRGFYTLYLLDCPMVCQMKPVQSLLEGYYEHEPEPGEDPEPGPAADPEPEPGEDPEPEPAADPGDDDGGFF